MQTLLTRENSIIAGNGFLKETIPRQEGGLRMLSINLFALNLTVSVRQQKLSGSRYEDLQRIKSMSDEILTRRMVYSRYIH